MNKFSSLILTLLVYTFVAKGQQKNQPIKLEFLIQMPSQIDGCSGLYTYDSTSLKKKKYILVTDLQETAFIKIEGKQITLKLVSNIELPKNASKSIYKGGGYTLVLSIKTLKYSGDEVSIEGGSVEISRGAYRVTIKIHGESGC